MTGTSRSGDVGSGACAGSRVSEAAPVQSSAAEAARAQSSVVGVAILIAVTALSLGALTAGAGVAVQSGLAAADAGAAADAMGAAVRPGAAGPASERFAFSRGSLRVVPRTVRVSNASSVVERRTVGGLVFESGDRRVAAVAGAVVRGRGENAQFARPPATAVGESALVVGVSRLNASDTGAVGGEGGTTVDLRVDVNRSRRQLPRDAYRVAIETNAPTAWERHFDGQGANTTRRDFDGDGVASVVAQFPDDRRLYLSVTDLELELEATRG
jgi:flagellin-like protein